MLHLLLLLFSGEICPCFQNSPDIVLNSELPENRSLLGQIGDPLTGTFKHGFVGNITTIQKDSSPGGFDKTGYHVKACCLPGTVGSEQTYNFPLMHGEAHGLHGYLFTVDLFDIVHLKRGCLNRPVCITHCRSPNLVHPVYPQMREFLQQALLRNCSPHPEREESPLRLLPFESHHYQGSQ